MKFFAPLKSQSSKWISEIFIILIIIEGLKFLKNKSIINKKFLGGLYENWYKWFW
jgi:hypothetical protein